MPGYIRGYDVRTGKKLWTFNTIPQPGEFGNETWENDSWKYTGNTGAWAPLSADEELGYVYIPVETPTGDFYGGHRLGDNLFSATASSASTREPASASGTSRLVHHDIWDWDLAAPPILVDITVDGKTIKAVAQVTKQAFTYVFDRVTGKPVWPIEERPVPQSDAPGEKTSPTQPFPTKPAAFDRQGVTLDDLIDFTPELKAEAIKIASQYALGRCLRRHRARTRTASADASRCLADRRRQLAGWRGRSGDGHALRGVGHATRARRAGARAHPHRHGLTRDGQLDSAAELGPQGLPLVKPPWGRITAIDLNTGDHVWMMPNGDTPEFMQASGAARGQPQQDRTPRAFADPGHQDAALRRRGSRHVRRPPGWGGPMFRALDKRTGKVIHEMKLPANVTGMPMTYMVDGVQYLVMAIGAPGVPAEMLALTVQ